MANHSGPGYAKNPGHTITVTPFRGRIMVEVGGETLADSREALLLQEASYPPVYYVPRRDTQMARLERTTHSTHCPFKGDASYFSIHGHAANAVWSYENPYDEVASIKDHLAFYPDKTNIVVLPADGHS